MALWVDVTGRMRPAVAVNGSIPGPTLRWREGEEVTIHVVNRLAESTSIHWHGIRLPAAMDGTPGLSFAGIPPGQTFTYRFKVGQSGTYWYHGHSGAQEPLGLYGGIIIDPAIPDPAPHDREHMVILGDWSDEGPMQIISNLKQQGDYYNTARPTLGGLLSQARRQGLGPALKDRAMWGSMRMSDADISDVTGATFAFLVNGRAPKANWTGLFAHGEKVRLRFVNAGVMTHFDVMIPGLPMTVLQADGWNVRPVEVDEFRMGPGETYDVIVAPGAADAYTVFAQAIDRSGYARGTLAVREGLSAPVPPMDSRPVRTMADMGGMAGMNHAAMPGMAMPAITFAEPEGPPVPRENADGVDPAKMRGLPNVDNVASTPAERLTEAGAGLDGNGRRVLTYLQLRGLEPGPDQRPPTREIEFHLTGNMERWTWGMDGKTFSEAGPIRLTLGERVRFVLVNDTMMEHPIHLHGLFSELDNGAEAHRPLKHTIIVKPGEKMSMLVSADAPGAWAFHCHLLYHMHMGMFRTVVVS